MNEVSEKSEVLKDMGVWMRELSASINKTSQEISVSLRHDKDGVNIVNVKKTLVASRVLGVYIDELSILNFRLNTVLSSNTNTGEYTAEFLTENSGR